MTSFLHHIPTAVPPAPVNVKSMVTFSSEDPDLQILWEVSANWREGEREKRGMEGESKGGTNEGKD